MRYEDWVFKNEDKLLEEYLDENADLQIHHRDYPDVPNTIGFQNWAEKKYKEFRNKRVRKVYVRRKDGVVQRYRQVYDDEDFDADEFMYNEYKDK